MSALERALSKIQGEVGSLTDGMRSLQSSVASVGVKAGLTLAAASPEASPMQQGGQLVAEGHDVGTLIVEAPDLTSNAEVLDSGNLGERLRHDDDAGLYSTSRVKPSVNGCTWAETIVSAASNEQLFPLHQKNNCFR